MFNSLSSHLLLSCFALASFPCDLFAMEDMAENFNKSAVSTPSSSLTSDVRHKRAHEEEKEAPLSSSPHNISKRMRIEHIEEETEEEEEETEQALATQEPNTVNERMNWDEYRFSTYVDGNKEYRPFDIWERAHNAPYYAKGQNKRVLIQSTLDVITAHHPKSKSNNTWFKDNDLENVAIWQKIIEGCKAPHSSGLTSDLLYYKCATEYIFQQLTPDFYKQILNNKVWNNQNLRFTDITGSAHYKFEEINRPIITIGLRCRYLVEALYGINTLNKKTLFKPYVATIIKEDPSAYNLVKNQLTKFDATIINENMSLNAFILLANIKYVLEILSSPPEEHNEPTLNFLDETKWVKSARPIPAASSPLTPRPIEQPSSPLIDETARAELPTRTPALPDEIQEIPEPQQRAYPPIKMEEQETIKREVPDPLSPPMAPARPVSATVQTKSQNALIAENLAFNFNSLMKTASTLNNSKSKETSNNERAIYREQILNLQPLFIEQMQYYLDYTLSQSSPMKVETNIQLPQKDNAPASGNYIDLTSDDNATYKD